MGIVFGRTGVAEPAYNVILSRTRAKVPYELRRYGQRFAIEAPYGGEDINSAFRLLAGYIGVGGPPQNAGSTSISMTAPVVTDTSGSGKGEKIAMTAPVVTKTRGEGSPSSGKTMQFILPAAYNDISKIPKPINPMVTVAEVSPAVGAVHKFDGWAKEKKAMEKVTMLVKQLAQDGLVIEEIGALNNYSLWQYNPPFTIPQLRRNEIWIELSEDDVDAHTKRFEE
mmetsp:Transcript_62509/g.184891  ORF Transcript_62509/g.184891 Transcript_62509/m.184891 type:complete len:225 (-) Transcript_62509:8-682(-)